MRLKMVAFAAGAVLLAAGAWAIWRPAAPAAQTGEAGQTGGGRAIVAVTVPELTGDAVIGQKVFASRCAQCHGPDAGGIEGAGPPLVHAYYRPGHHADAAFYIAATNGVRAHHWNFGDMPPVSGVTRAEIAAAVAFVRQVQRANGIR